MRFRGVDSQSLQEAPCGKASHRLSRRTRGVVAAARDSARGPRSRSSRADGGSLSVKAAAETEDFERTLSAEYKLSRLGSYRLRESCVGESCGRKVLLVC